LFSKKSLIILLFFIVAFTPTSYAKENKWTVGVGAEVVPQGELSQSYDFLFDATLQYNFKHKKNHLYFLDFGFNNSLQDGSTYSQFRAGAGLRYYYAHLNNFSFFIDGSLALAFSRETFYIQLSDQDAEVSFDDFGVVAKASSGFFINSTYGFSLSIKQNHDQATTAGINFLFSF